MRFHFFFLGTGFLLLLLLVSCLNSPDKAGTLAPSNSGQDEGFRLVTVYVTAGEWNVFTEKTLLAQASAYSDWTDFKRDATGGLSLNPLNGVTGRVVGKKQIAEGLWEVRLSRLALKMEKTEKAHSVQVSFLIEETGGLLPSLFALQKALKGEKSGRVRVALMNAWPDGRFEALVELQ